VASSTNASTSVNKPRSARGSHGSANNQGLGLDSCEEMHAAFEAEAQAEGIFFLLSGRDQATQLRVSSPHDRWAKTHISTVFCHPFEGAPQAQSFLKVHPVLGASSEGARYLCPNLFWRARSCMAHGQQLIRRAVPTHL